VALAIGLAVGLAALTFFLVLVVGLVRHLNVLTASLRRFQHEVQPVLEEIQRQSVTAQERIQGLGEGPGGRLRR